MVHCESHCLSPFRLPFFPRASESLVGGLLHSVASSLWGSWAPCLPSHWPWNLIGHDLHLYLFYYFIPLSSLVPATQPR